MRIRVRNEWRVSQSSISGDFSPPLALAEDLRAILFWTENDEEEQ